MISHKKSAHVGVKKITSYTFAKKLCGPGSRIYIYNPREMGFCESKKSQDSLFKILVYSIGGGVCLTEHILSLHFSV